MYNKTMNNVNTFRYQLRGTPQTSHLLAMQMAAMLVTSSDVSGDQHARASSAAPRNGTSVARRLRAAI
jgi:hypothetical protein